jgi:hypothetical protein
VQVHVGAQGSGDLLLGSARDSSDVDSVPGVKSSLSLEGSLLPQEPAEDEHATTSDLLELEGRASSTVEPVETAKDGKRPKK